MTTIILAALAGNKVLCAATIGLLGLAIHHVDKMKEADQTSEVKEVWP